MYIYNKHFKKSNTRLPKKVLLTLCMMTPDCVAAGDDHFPTQRQQTVRKQSGKHLTYTACQSHFQQQHNVSVTFTNAGSVLADGKIVLHE